MLTISRMLSRPDEAGFEVVERKGLGHPDTLSDALAESLSVAYSQYTLQRFGAILRHQFDKTMIMCGRASVGFGAGHLVEPIRVLLNGRASARLGSEPIPVQDLVLQTARSFFQERFPDLHPERDFRYLYEVRQGEHSTTGGVRGEPEANDASVHFRFNPRSLDDLPETHRPEANDTSLGCAWSSPTALERTVLAVEQSLNLSPGRTAHPWLGSDVKVMGVRQGRNLSLTVAAPILSRLTSSASVYFDRVDQIRAEIVEVVRSTAPDHDIAEVVVNSGDDLARRKLYLNFTGSSIESGDEGAVGRGNRVGGIIAPARPLTLEGIGGKNGRYQLGKLYCAAAWDIADRLAAISAAGAHVYLVNRMGEPLECPWHIHLEIDKDGPLDGEAERLCRMVLDDLPAVTARILTGGYPLF